MELFATDLDGTLLNQQHQSDAYIQKGLKALQQAGHITAVATGRPVKMVDPKELPGCYYVVMNGAALLNPQREVLDFSPIDPAIIQELWELFPNLPLEFNTLDHIYIRQSQEEMQKLHTRFRKPGSGFIPMKTMDRFADFRRYEASLEDVLAQPVMKINMLRVEGEALERFDRYMQENQHRLVNAASLSHLDEITRADVNKALGVQKLAKILKIPFDQVAVFGDGGNDLPMLEAFEHSYAPCTGSEKAREAAKHVIGPYETYSVMDEMLKIAGLPHPKKGMSSE